MKFQHISTRLPGLTSQKTASIKIQFITGDRVTRKFMAGLEVLQHSAETKPLWRPGIPHFHKFWLCGRNEMSNTWKNPHWIYSLEHRFFSMYTIPFSYDISIYRDVWWPISWSSGVWCHV